jgi:aminotransferase
MTRFRSRHLDGMAQSDIRRMTRECNAIGGLNLGQGICDLPTPDPVRQAAMDAIAQGQSIYSPMHGRPELRAALADKLRRHNGLAYDPDSEIVVTPGSSGAYSCVLHGLLEQGDGIVLFEPYYGYHLNAARAAGLQPSFVTLTPPDFAVAEAQVRAALTPKTKAIVLCTPSNPCGKVWTEPELQMIAGIAEEADLLVLTDEVYEYIVFDGREHVSPATLPALRDRTVTMTSLSKTFSITGWRIGMAAAPPELASTLMLVNDLQVVCAPTPLQLGAAAGLGMGDDYFDGLTRQFTVLRDLLCSALTDVGLTPIVPQGAYYVLADVTKLGKRTGREAAMHILQEVGVASVSGACFYRGSIGEGLVRFCFAKEEPVLREACARIRRLA